MIITNIGGNSGSKGPIGTLVGGKIFYDNGDNGCTYRFWDVNGSEITSRAISDLQNAYYYEKTGTSSTDRFYAALFFDNRSLWRSTQLFSATLGLATLGTEIGTGKSNSASIASNGDQYKGVFTYLLGLNDSNYLHDYFIGSKDEVEAARVSGILPSSISNNHIWSSSTDYSSAYVWLSTKSAWGTQVHTFEAKFFYMRSF